MSFKYKVLYVEDNEVDQELFKASLEMEALEELIELDLALSIEEAKQKALSQTFELILSDWNLPDGNAIDLASYLKQNNITASYIFLSALFTAEQKDEAEPFSPLLLIKKGSNDDELFNYLKSLLKTK